MRKVILVFLGAALAGCASVTEPIRYGRDSFVVNSQASGTFYSWGEVKNMAIAKANEHCDKLGQAATVEGEEYSGVRSVVPIEAHIKFKCVDR